uniref:RNA-directed DNA polymerase n=1 Tax=Daphnia magna TaxID=35525 RepID=A0A0P6D7J8_9CRUS
MASFNDNHELDNEQYYAEILRYLEDPTGVNINTSTKAQWIRTQAANYFLKNGELYYGRRKPRKVVLDKNAKASILEQIHIDGTKGFHNGVKKMHRMLQQTHFWRYSYKSITEYVQNCTVCKSNAMTTLNFVKSNKVTCPWTEIEFHQIKPNQSSQEKYLLLIIYDPVSFWISVAAIKPSSYDMAEFLFENLCSYGVALCTVYGLNSFEFMELKGEFARLISMTETTTVLNAENHLKFSEKESSEFDANMKTRIDMYLEGHPNDWYKRTTILGWLWKLRNEVVKNTSALDAISKRCFAKTSNAGNQFQKTRKKSKLFQCPPCDETSCSEQRLTRRSNSKHRMLGTESTLHGTEDTSTNPSLDNRTSTSTAVAAVRALIAQTKEVRKSRNERHKRGEYHRYTAEMKEAIAIHAMRHGTHNAARTFSTSLGFPVSYSSVRNFVQAHHAFSSQLKAEIGRHAAECGLDATQKLYSTKLEKTISISLIRKFRRMYLRITPANQLDHSGSRKSMSFARHLFCASVREEIGKYAAVHGVPAAVRHFSDKLQFSVKESTVRKFRKIFGPPAAELRRTLSSASSMHPPPPPPSPPSSVAPPSSLSVLQQQSPDTGYYHQPYGHYTNTHMYVGHQSANNYHNQHQNMYNVMSQPVPPYPSYSSLPPPPQYQPSFSSVQLPAYSRNWNEECSDVSTSIIHHPSENPPASTCLPVPRTPSPAAIPPPPPPPLELNPAVQISVGHEMPAQKTKISKKNGRGSYATYPPQFRLEIGRFAAEYGCQEAADYFKERVGHEIPESTVRGLRDKYVAQQRTSEEQITNLNALPRGRPLRLGPHDEAVQECIRELKRSGERVNAFVAMATARQVLLQKEPSLLPEFGGPVKLTTNWAKSFLKRIGINKENTSHNDVATSSNIPSD